MKTFVMVISIIGIVLILLLGWGVLCPMLISSPTDIGVILGIVMILVVPVIAYLISRLLFKQIKSKAKDDYNKYWKS
jgi:hypothetical protein